MNSTRQRYPNRKDGTGTTSFGYHPVTTGAGTLGARRLASVDGPLANDTITYNYDELGRVLSKAVNSVGESLAFDALGRLTSHATSSIGTFTPGYVGDTHRLASFAYPNNQTTTFDYFGATGDFRLKQIWNKTSGAATISKFDYQADVLGRITQWTQQAGTATPQVLTPEYDREDQLLGALIAPQGLPQSPAKAYDYTYDLAGNRTTEQMETAGTSPTFSVTAATYNNVNQLNVRQGTGSLPVKFRGTVNEPATVTVNGQAATMKQDPNSPSNGKIFTRTLTLPAGNNSVPVVATDFGVPPHATTQNYTVNVVAGADRSYTYDANGNCTGYTSTSGNVTYEWDAEDRLVAINNGTLRSEFTYDGFSRRVKIVEKNNNTITSTKQFVWVGKQICEERDGNNQVQARFYAEGFIRYASNAQPLYYTRDHLGNIRELTDSGGTVRARYDYDPYGRVTKVSGDLDSDFRYTGHYFHAPSGLHLALYRAYDADTGRWLNQDPIGEEGGLNLYGYVGNNPVNLIDPLGLTWGSNWNFFWDWAFGGGRQNRNYDPNSVENQEMQNSPGGNKLRDAFYNNGCKNVNNFGYGTMEAAKDTIPYHLDSTAFQVGGFGGASAVDNGDGTATFTIPNKAGTESFFGHYLQLFDKSINVSDRSSNTGPMRNIYQNFQWTEPIDKSKCKCPNK